MPPGTARTEAAGNRATEIIAVDPQRIERGVMTRAAEVLRGGGLVAFPTETVYGLGADALSEIAVAGIFEAKGRPATNPLIVHVLDADAARSLVTRWPEAAQLLTARFWPGPLTLVLPRSAIVPDIVTAGGPTVAIRAPSHPVAQALLREARLPIAAPSANRSSRVSPTLAEHVLRSLGGRIDLILDAGPTAGGIESTVLDISTQTARLLRPGPIAPAEIEAVIGLIERGSDSSLVRRSPGLLPRHYAPAAPMELIAGGCRARVAALVADGHRPGCLTIGELCPGIDGAETIVMPEQPAAYAAMLYAALHTLDERGVDRILVETPPDSEDWLAIRDRLQRAAAIPCEEAA